MYGHGYDTDETDGGAYVCEEDGEQQNSDDDGSEGRRAQGKHRSTKERVLSNRLAASRSYQRRKEEMLRLEVTHARLQVCEARCRSLVAPWLPGSAARQFRKTTGEGLNNLCILASCLLKDCQQK
jgi:hypothetical protein